MNVLFVTYFLAVFVSAGLSFRLGDRISLYLVLILPFVLLLFTSITKNIVIFPRKLSYIWLGFSIFDLVATYFSSNRQLSIERFLLYQSAYLIGIHFYSFKEKLGHLLDKAVNISSIIFILAFIFKDKILTFIRFIDVNQAYNFYYPLYPNNNHLGIWLGLTLICLYFWKKYLHLVLVVPFFLLSLSRTAFISIYSLWVINFISLRDRIISRTAISKSKVWLGLLLTTAVFLIGIVILVPRNTVLGRRDQYVRVALEGFKENPFFGSGPGNYVGISRKYAAITYGTFGTSSHNIFMDILSGSGIFAFIFFCLLFYRLFKNSRKNRYFYSFLYLILCFLITYIYMMPLMVLLLFAYAGLSYQEKNNYIVKKTALIYPIVIFIFAVYLMASETLYLRGNLAGSLKIYPYRSAAYEELISQIPYEHKRDLFYNLNMYKKHFPGVFDQLNYSANIYSRMGEYEKALSDYMTIYENGTGFNSYFVREIQFLYLKMNDPVSSYKFSVNYIKKVFANPEKYSHMVYDTKLFCIETYKFFLNKGYCF